MRFQLLHDAMKIFKWQLKACHTSSSTSSRRVSNLKLLHLNFHLPPILEKGARIRVERYILCRQGPKDGKQRIIVHKENKDCYKRVACGTTNSYFCSHKNDTTYAPNTSNQSPIRGMQVQQAFSECTNRKACTASIFRIKLCV